MWLADWLTGCTVARSRQIYTCCWWDALMHNFNVCTIHCERHREKNSTFLYIMSKWRWFFFHSRFCIPIFSLDFFPFSRLVLLCFMLFLCIHKTIAFNVYEWAWTVFHLVCWWMIVISVVWRQTRAQILFVRNSARLVWCALTCVYVHIFILTTNFLIFSHPKRIAIEWTRQGQNERATEREKMCILFNYFFSTFVNCVHNAI